MAKQKIIKRYANRKLYDIENSTYITLDSIAKMVKEGLDVHIIDNKTGEDITTVTLAQVVVEEERKVRKMPRALFRGIIHSGGETIGGILHFPKEIRRLRMTIAALEKRVVVLEQMHAKPKRKVKKDELH